MKINEHWEELKEKSHTNIQSEKGILNRQIRSIQTEGHFGDIKENDDFRRFNHRTADKVYKEFMLYAIGRNINQIAVRLHSTGNIYAEDMTEIKRGVNQIWQLLLSIRSRAISAAQSPTSLTEIRPSTEYMSHLICAGTTAEGQQRISTPSESEEQDELPF